MTCVSVDQTSYVVSDRLGNSIDKAGLYDKIGSDIQLATWDYFITHSVDFEVLVLDLDLSNYADTVGMHSSKKEITDYKEKFFSAFRSMHSEVSYFLESGDTVIVLLDNPLPVTKSTGYQQSERTGSVDWLQSMGLLENLSLNTSASLSLVSETEPLKGYFHAVSRHYEVEVNDQIVFNPEILAKASDGTSPAAMAINEFIDESGSRIETTGTIILLPPPKSITKPHKLVENLVDLAWEFHEGDRPEISSGAVVDQSIQLSMSLEYYDDELVEHCLSKYSRGEYADAATKACKILETRVKQRIGSDLEYKSTADLMKKAFRPSEGPLSMGEETGEEEGVMFLYSGAVQGLRNPLSHRVVDPEGDRFLDDFDQQKAHDIISYVNLLLRLLEET